MKNTRTGLLPLLLLTLALAACGPSAQPTVATPTSALPPALSVAPSATVPAPSPDVVAAVNGEPIQRGRWERQVARIQIFLKSEQGVDESSAEGQTQLEQAAQHVLEEMIDEQLIRQAARSLNLSISESQLDEVVSRDIELGGGRARFDEWLARNTLTMEEYRAATELQLLTSALREHVTSTLPAAQPQVHLRHILLASEADAADVLAQLGGGAAFETVAAERSIDPGSQSKGGDLGWLPRGLLPASVDAVVWQLGPGERSSIIQSEFGYHIVEVLEQDPARPLPLEMLQTLQQQAWERWLVTERAGSTIERWLTP